MKNNIFTSFFVFNFILSLSAMEQTAAENFAKPFDTLLIEQFVESNDQMPTQAKRDAETVLDILRHNQLVATSKIKQLRNNASSKDMSIQQCKNFKKSGQIMIQKLQEILNSPDSSDVYFLIPDLLCAHAYFVDAYTGSGDVSTEVSDQLYKNLGKLTLISYNEDVKRVSSCAFSRPAKMDGKKIKILFKDVYSFVPHIHCAHACYIMDDKKVKIPFEYKSLHGSAVEVFMNKNHLNNK